MNSSILGSIQLTGGQYKKVLVPFVLRLVPGAEAIVAVVGILVLKSARGIDEPVFESKIPVRTDILGVYDIDELLRLTGQHITQFGIWLGGIIEFGLARIEEIEVVRMPARVPSRLHPGSEYQVTGRRAQVAQVDPGIGAGYFTGEVENGGVQFLQPAGIEITEIDGDGIVLSVLERILFAASAPATDITKPA